MKIGRKTNRDTSIYDPEHRQGRGAGGLPSPLSCKIDREGFPDKPASPASNIPATYENFEYLMDSLGISARFNLIKKRPEIVVPELNVGSQNKDEVTFIHVQSQLVRNQMSVGSAQAYLLAMADENPFDPFADWVSSRPWDGKSRLSEIYETITPEDGYPTTFRDVLIRKWLLSIVAATFKRSGFRARGVLTIQGQQGLGKTSWIANLVTDQRLRDDVIKLGHSWDGGSKDAKLGAIRHRIVEWGELDGSLGSALAGLKAFLTETYDKIRVPYGRLESEYPRSTVFAASVNERQFLKDSTGNSRFWTIAAKKIDYDHAIDMQQVFAELKAAYDQGEQWWLTTDEEEELERINQFHREQTSIEAKLGELIEPSRLGENDLPRLTANEVLYKIGISHPTNRQSKDANAALRGLLGQPKRVKGLNRWAVPWRPEAAPIDEFATEDDEY